MTQTTCFNPLCSGDTLWRHIFGQHWLRYWLIAITWTNVDIPWVRPVSIIYIYHHLRDLNISISKPRLEIAPSKSYPDLWWKNGSNTHLEGSILKIASYGRCSTRACMQEDLISTFFQVYRYFALICYSQYRIRACHPQICIFTTQTYVPQHTSKHLMAWY